MGTRKELARDCCCDAGFKYHPSWGTCISCQETHTLATEVVIDEECSGEDVIPGTAWQSCSIHQHKCSKSTGGSGGFLSNLLGLVAALGVCCLVGLIPNGRRKTTMWRCAEAQFGR